MNAKINHTESRGHAQISHAHSLYTSACHYNGSAHIHSHASTTTDNLIKISIEPTTKQKMNCGEKKTATKIKQQQGMRL